MKKIIIFLGLFYIAFITLMPKENLYYTLQNRLQAERVVLTQEQLSDNLISLQGENMSLFYDGIKSVEVDAFSVMVLGFYNKINALNIEPAKELQKMFGFSADEIEITYALWNYTAADISATGDFGSIEGTFEPFTGTLKLLLEPSLAFEKSSLIRQYFKKGEEGYIYESKIK